MNEWPKLDPITGRKICQSCWEGIHYHELRFRKNFQGKMENYWVKCERLQGKAEHACDGECDCVHRSEETWTAIEKAKVKSNRIALRKNLQEHLENSPLAAQNEVKMKKSKRDHA